MVPGLLASMWLMLAASAATPTTSAVTEVAHTEVASEGSVDAYLALALEQSPEVRAAFHRWESAVHRVARARTLPEPTVSFGVFVQSVETRVGPQQARISVKQAFPWPTALTAGGKAAGAEAQAAASALESTSLGVAHRVSVAFWTLWEVRATRALHQEHLEIVGGLSEAVRARLTTGGATLADLQQVDLSRARLEDGIRSMDEAEHVAQAELLALIGERGVRSLPTTTSPVLSRPDEVDLEGAVLRHPSLTLLGHRADAADARARAAGAGRLPSFTVGGDWIVTGPAVMPDTPDSGKDAVVASVGLRVPLWQGTYGHQIAAERSTAEARRSEQAAQGDRALADLERALAQVRDSERRVGVLSDTLLPQAEAAYASVLGSYAVGDSAVAQTLLSQRDLLELGVERARASADHQRAWAQLDQLVGAEVARGPVTDPESAP